MNCVATSVAYSCIEDSLKRLDRVASILVAMLEGYSVDIGAREIIQELFMVVKNIKRIVAECGGR